MCLTWREIRRFAIKGGYGVFLTLIENSYDVYAKSACDYVSRFAH